MIGWHVDFMLKGSRFCHKYTVRSLTVHGSVIKRPSLYTCTSFDEYSGHAPCTGIIRFTLKQYIHHSLCIEHLMSSILDIHGTNVRCSILDADKLGCTLLAVDPERTPTNTSQSYKVKV